MVKRNILLMLIAFSVFSGPLFSANLAENPKEDPLDELRSVAPNLFLDCDRRTCDLNYIRTEITFVNYVRDRESGDIHVLITRQRTSSGGREYTLSFIGLKKFDGRNSTLKYFSKSTDTSDQVRKGMVNVLKQGLIPYISDTPLSEFISISYRGQSQYRQAQPEDKWKNWVFSTSFRGNLNYETNSKRYSYNISLSANQTTETTKFRFYASGNFNERRYIVSKEEEIVSQTSRKYSSTSLIKSINDHWSYGLTLSLYSSTYDNADLYTSIGPAIEYNIFPYDQSTRRQLRIQYRITYSHRDYDEITFYDKIEEGLMSQRLEVILQVREPWGSVGGQIEGSNFFHDFNKYNLKFEAGLSMRVFKGLSFNASGEYSRVRDQLSLPKGGASKDEILLELKRLATNYDLSLQFGCSFRFGSIYSNIVNPRFGNR